MFRRIISTSTTAWIGCMSIGCVNAGLHEEKRAEAPPATVAPEPQQPASLNGRAAVPQVFTGRFSPKPLTQEQTDRVLAEAEASAPSDRNVWFIRVHRNSLQSESDDLNVSIYFTPNEESPQIREGRFFRIDSQMDALLKSLAIANAPQRNRQLSSYCQISLPDRPFGGDLKTPTVDELPFESPVSLEDQEIIEIVDFVRTNPDQESPPPRSLKAVLPIMEIRRVGGTFVIKLGWLEGFLSGIGQIIRCVRTEDGLKVEAVGQWVS